MNTNNINKLDPGSEEIQQMVELVTEKIIDFMENLDEPVLFDIEKSKQQALEQSELLPETEMPLKDILDDLFDQKIKQAFNTTHPGFFAYIPGGGIFHAALAELIVKVTNRYVGIDIAAPFLSQLEADVLKWFCHMVGYPDSSGGTMTSGGSIANLTAVICARTLLMGDDFAKGTVYASDFVHHSMWKAFHAAGIPSSNIRKIPVNNNFQPDLNQLRIKLEEDVKNGFRPLMLIATSGSTNTGTIDPLEQIAELSQEFSTWFHIDASYGGFFAMTKRGKKLLAGMELADSITMNPHKGLFIPYGTGIFIVKDRHKLKQVFTHNADYIPDKKPGPEFWDFSEMSLELTRPFRGLGIWLPFKMLGAGAFRKELDEKLDLAQYFHKLLSNIKHWQIIASPELTLTVFRYYNPQFSKEELYAINHDVIDYINNKCSSYLSGTIISGNFVIRCCVLSYRTHKIHLDNLLEELEEGLDVTLSKVAKNSNE